MRPRLLIGLVAGLVLILGVVLILRGGEDDPEMAIRMAIERTAQAAEAQDVGGVMEVISERFKGRGMDRRDLTRYVFAQLRTGRWRSVFIVRTDVDLKDEQHARVRTSAVLARGAGITSLAEAAKTRADAYRFDLDFEREDDGEWRVVVARYGRVGPKELFEGLAP